jgi:hypothetical protein
MNGDGVSCSQEVELPTPRQPVSCDRCYKLADDISRLERLLRDQEKLLGFGSFASRKIDPFGSVVKENTP